MARPIVRSLILVSIALWGNLLWAGKDRAMVALHYAEEMEKAKNLKDVLRIVHDTQVSFPIPGTERLLVFDRIPKFILDVSEVVQKITKSDLISQDQTLAAELVYFSELARLYRSYPKIKLLLAGEFKIVRFHFKASVLFWHKYLEPTLHNQVSELGLENSSQTLSPEMRMEALAEFLNNHLTNEQLEALLELQKEYVRDVQKDLSLAKVHIDKKNTEYLKSLDEHYGKLAKILEPLFGPISKTLSKRACATAVSGQ